MEFHRVYFLPQLLGIASQAPGRCLDNDAPNTRAEPQDSGMYLGEFLRTVLFFGAEAG